MKRHFVITLLRRIMSLVLDACLTSKLVVLALCIKMANTSTAATTSHSHLVKNSVLQVSCFGSSDEVTFHWQ